MRILRGLSSRVLSCGCLAGVYETYDGDIVGILDARGPACAVEAHEPGENVPLDFTHHAPSPPAEAPDQPSPSV